MTRYSTCSRCFGRRQGTRRRRLHRSGRRHRPRDARRDGPSGRGPDRRIVRRRRPQSAGVRPQDPHRDAARLVQEVDARAVRRRLGQGRPRRGTRRHADAPLAAVGPDRAHPGREPGGVHVRDGLGHGRDLLQERHRRAEEVGRAGRRARLGRHHGADRARRGLRRRRRPHQGRAAGRRHLAHRRRQALHHLGRLRRPVREHHASGAGPPRGRRPGHQGVVAVLRAEVPLRPRDRRAR